jgi:hypothetical protein
MLGQAGEDAMRYIIAGVPFGEKAGALINSYVNGSSYADELAKVRAGEQATGARQGPVASFGEQAVGTMLPGGAIAKGLAALGMATEGTYHGHYQTEWPTIRVEYGSARKSTQLGGSEGAPQVLARIMLRELVQDTPDDE